MKDIVPKVRPHSPAPKTSSALSTTGFRKKLATFAEKSIEQSARYCNWLYQTYSSPRAIISEPTLRALPEEERRTVEDRRTKDIHPSSERRKGERRQKIASSLKNKAQNTRRSLKTPIGKLAIVQTAAIVGLFVYVSYTNRGVATKTENLTSGTVSNSSNLQRYLPSVPQYSQPIAFDETTLTKTATGISLHTWLTPWNITELEEHKDRYSSVSAFWLTVQSDGIHLEPKSDWNLWQGYAKLPKKQSQTTFLTVSGDPNYTYLALMSPETQEQHINELLRIVEEQGFDGIDIDYEGLGSDNRDSFTHFIRNLTTTFHSHNKLVAVTVEARLNNEVPMDWQALGQIADQMRLMVYDYHARNTGAPGPVSPVGWLKEVMDYAQATITKSQIVVGLGNYGYDWTRTVESDGSISWIGKGLSFDQAMALASEKQIPIVRATGIDERGYDIGSAPNFNYKDSSGTEHSVWFEDNQSLQNKINIISQYKTSGVIFWSVGLGDKAFWQSTLSR